MVKTKKGYQKQVDDFEANDGLSPGSDQYEFHDAQDHESEHKHEHPFHEHHGEHDDHHSLHGRTALWEASPNEDSPPRPDFQDQHHRSAEEVAHSQMGGVSGACWACNCQPDPRPRVHKLFSIYWLHLGGYVLPSIFFSIIFMAVFGAVVFWGITGIQSSSSSTLNTRFVSNLVSHLVSARAGDDSDSLCSDLVGLSCSTSGWIVLIVFMLVVIPVICFACGLTASCLLYIETTKLYVMLPPGTAGEPASFKPMNLGQLITLAFTVIFRLIGEVSGVVAGLFDVLVLVFWIAHLCCFYLLIGRVRDYVIRISDLEAQNAHQAHDQTTSIELRAI
ncbi:MAG: hypothetical protein K2Z81_07715 [Cyanobacteria bacterium]|nr:hypothetical protein [Cyanobacteriota bacterium]